MLVNIQRDYPMSWKLWFFVHGRFGHNKYRKPLIKLTDGGYEDRCDIGEYLLSAWNYDTIFHGRVYKGKRQRMFCDYGICDNYQQILASSDYAYLRDPAKKYIILLHKVTKRGSPNWRWHKNGPYIGTQNHRCEYIGEEPEIERVYGFSIYQIV